MKLAETLAPVFGQCEIRMVREDWGWLVQWPEATARLLYGDGESWKIAVDGTGEALLTS